MRMGAGGQCVATSQGALDDQPGLSDSFAGRPVLGLRDELLPGPRALSPAVRLTSARGGIAGGDYCQRVEVGGGAEIKELAHAFNSLAESLQTNEKLRRNMVADIAHELRNPLASIKAQLEAVEDGVMEADPGTLASISEDVEVLARLVDDLRQLSLVEAGQMELERLALDAGDARPGWPASSLTSSRLER